VTGSVQGVGFRWFVQSRANRLGLVGGVRNLADGSVEVIAEGPIESLTELLAALQEGPSGAHVGGMTHAFLPGTHRYTAFEVWSSR